jgi:hypothetical protein
MTDRKIAPYTPKMKGFALAAILIAALSPMMAAGPDLAVGRFGGYMMSRKVITLWLAAPDRRPLLMAYFCAPRGWRTGTWDLNSSFKTKRRGWVELQSETASLRLEIDMDTGEVEVQSDKFKLHENNTFLVLQGPELLVSPKIIPLGEFDLRPSNRHAASVRLLREHPELIARINKEALAVDRKRPDHDTRRDRSRTWPCTEKRLDVLHENPVVVWAAFSYAAASSRFLNSAYSLPCCGGHHRCN